MVEDQADLEMSHTVMAAFALCHADARAGGRRLRLVCVLGSQVLVRLVARRPTGDIPIRYVPAYRLDFASRCACVQVRSRECLRICCRCVCAVGCGRSACRGCARESGCDNHALIRSGRVGVWQWLIKCARPHNATVIRPDLPEPPST